nr:hypothetical protein [Tanacetum cinerariifolium]
MKKHNGLTFFIVVLLFTLIIASTAARTHQTTIPNQTRKQTGDANAKTENVAHTNNDWGGCWDCWHNHDRRLLR